MPASPDAAPRAPWMPQRRPRALLRRRLGAWTVRLGIGHVPSDGAELEALVGRYGTLALAVLLILMGLGAFLTWAIAAVTLTPIARVALGAVGAAALAAGGWRLRSRADAAASGTRRFGDALLALALAAAHVVAWGAGPALGLVSPAAALLVAAVASGALALLAWRERDQALFVVGVGGALAAPFVTGADTGHASVLATYGWVVLSAGVVALPHARVAGDDVRLVRWTLAARVLGLGGAFFAGALLRDATEVAAIGSRAVVGLPVWQPDREVPVLFALACAAVPLLLPRRARRAGVALMHLTTAFGAVLTLALSTGAGEPMLAAYAFVATIGALLAIGTVVPAERAPGRGARRGALLGALALPLALLAAALVALRDATSATGALLAGAWTVASGVAGFVALRRPDAATSPLPGAHVAAAGLAAAVVPLLALDGQRVALVLALAAHAAVFAQVVGPIPRSIAALPSLCSLGLAGAGAATLLRQRPAFGYTPFLTSASLATVAVIAACAVLAWRVRRHGAGAFARGERTVLAALPAIGALLWGREELARVGSPELSTFLLVGYFAAAGVAALAVGRARRVAGARQVGLALAIYAALKALAQASELRAVGLRVGSYLLVGAFLLAVGYWYRSAGERTPAPEPAAP
ncbi:MAG: hypothetical protein ACXW05_02300 [Gemmatirosa sp.]